jgi:hypothetical protein
VVHQMYERCDAGKQEHNLCIFIEMGNMWQMAWGAVNQCLVCDDLPSAVVLSH